MVAAGSQIDRKLLIGILETVDSWVSFCAEKNTVYPPWPGHRSNWVAGKGTTLIDLCLDSWWLTCWDDDNDIPIIPKKNPQETIASVMFLIGMKHDDTTVEASNELNIWGMRWLSQPLFRIWISLSSVETCCPTETCGSRATWVAIFHGIFWWISPTRMD